MTGRGRSIHEGLYVKVRHRLLEAGMTTADANEAIVTAIDGKLRYVELSLNDRLLLRLSVSDILRNSTKDFSKTSCGGPDDQPPPQEARRWGLLSMHPGEPCVRWCFSAYFDRDPPRSPGVGA